MESIQSNHNAALAVEGAIEAKALTWISTQDGGVASEDCYNAYA